MSDIIKLLPDHVANQIAAGEVVQRPSSVVKELLENAIDAGATHIKLIVKDAGKTLIQVIDNGIGMSVTDARLSFERHATSKIKAAEDLFNLHTKGFRGEALASIAAIAHVEMNTREETDDLGIQLTIEGSKVIAQEPVVTPKGTSVAVKNLFYNIPARRNFLKSNQVELKHIIDEFQRVALAHAAIHFEMYQNGNELFNLTASNLRQRIVAVFGKKMNEKLVPVEEETDVVKISGFVCKPEFAKKSRGEQFFFANNRFIKSGYLHHGVTTAFEGLIHPKSHPSYFLYLEVNPSTIDINIHPTKTEVKFDDEHALYAMLKATVKHSLGQFNVTPVLDFERDGNLDTPYYFKNKEAALPTIEVDSNFNPFQEASQNKITQNFNFKKEKIADWESLYTDVASHTSNLNNIEVEIDQETGTLFKEDAVANTKVTYQFQKKYIITTIKSGLVVIHQNRAHERVLYEQFLKNITIEQGVCQQLLFPLQLHFSKEDIVTLQQLQDNLEQIGFSFKTLQPDGVVLTGIPVNTTENQVKTVLEELIANMQQDIPEDGFSQTDTMAKSLSKSLAVKTGTALDAISMETLINQLFTCKEPMVTPFNKPTFVTYTINDIDNKF